MSTTGYTYSWRRERFLAIHDVTTDTIKAALFTSAATLTPALTTAYSATGEATGTGYSAGGVTLTGVSLSSAAATVYVDWGDIAFGTISTSFDTLLLYNASKANRAILILALPQTYTVTSQTVTFTLPSPSVDTAFLRLTAVP
jgi:hypothetical protein